MGGRLPTVTASAIERRGLRDLIDIPIRAERSHYHRSE